jgi:hypothetical protein
LNSSEARNIIDRVRSPYYIKSIILVYKGAKPMKLSTRRRYGARALLDLAPAMVREIGRIVLDINQRGTSVLLVEQNARLALFIAQRGYVLETGSIFLEGKSEELLYDERVKRPYLGQ